MQKIKLLMIEIKDSLKWLLVGVLALLIITSIQACQSDPVKRKTEIWLIDGEADVLYRVSGPGQEQTIKIKGNSEAMNNFMCIDRHEADYWIEELNE